MYCNENEIRCAWYEIIMDAWEYVYGVLDVIPWVS